MARGYCFEVVVDAKEEGSLTEFELYDEFGALCVDYVKDLDESEQQEARKELLDKLESYGANVMRDSNGFLLTDAVKMHWFEWQFEGAKAALAGMSLRDFATDEGARVFNLQNLIDDSIDDTVYDEYGSCWHSFDSWLRDASTNTPYYLKNVVLMH